MTLLVLLLAAAVIRLWIVTGRLSRRVAQLEAGVASGRIVPAPTVAPKERPALGPAPAWGPGEASMFFLPLGRWVPEERLMGWI